MSKHYVYSMGCTNGVARTVPAEKENPVLYRASKLDVKLTAGDNAKVF